MEAQEMKALLEGLGILILLGALIGWGLEYWEKRDQGNNQNRAKQE